MADTRKHGPSTYGSEGSIIQNADAKTLRKIKRARARYLRDQRAMETWASNGFGVDNFGDDEMPVEESAKQWHEMEGEAL